MKPDWILIANATHARILQQEGNGPVALVAKFSHSEGRSKASEPANDRVGHERFARQLTEYLERAALQDMFASLAIFASSPFLGELKAHIGDAALKRVSGAHDVDLTSVGVTELKRRIAHELAH